MLFVYDQSHQSVQGVSAGQGALFDLFDRIETFFRRLEAYVELPPTTDITDTIVNVMVEILLILALATKEIKQGKISELISPMVERLLSYFSSERFFKKLIGRSDIEDASRRLDSLMQHEHRMAAAQDLRATHRVDGRVMDIQHDVQGVDERVRGVDERTQGVDERVQGVDKRVKDVGDQIDVVIDGTHLLFASSSRPLPIEQFCD